ncbi:hypothetical protein JCM11251_002657 [Rhodosporidiobolus azoricus]
MQNYYAGNPLNRLSYLRSSPAFLASALRSPKSRFILLDSLAVLVEPETEQDPARHIATVGWTDVEAYIGDAEKVFKGVDGKKDDDFAELAVLGEGGKQFGKETVGQLTHEEKRQYFINQPAFVFLGVDERSAPASAQSLPLTKPDEHSTLETHSPHGIPYWAMDISRYKDLKAKVLAEERQGKKREFGDLRAGSQTIPGDEAAIAAEARALVDWNTRNRFCPSCARPLRSVWGGWKRQCIPGEPAADGIPADPPCLTKKGVHNTSYPRTDPVVIMAVLSPDREKILLGRQRSWPAKFYSCLAGFIESAESFEEAVKREVYEEAGIVLETVGYHSSQPWPYPSSLMLGAWGVAKEGQTIRCDLDNELEDARYFTRAEVLKVIDANNPLLLTQRQLAKMDGNAGAQQEKSEAEKAGKEEPLFRMPPSTAIANTLITAWARGTLFQPGSKI